MTGKTFKELLENSRELSSKYSLHEIPPLVRSIAEVDHQTGKLIRESPNDTGSIAKGNIFLASNGIDSSKLESKIGALKIPVSVNEEMRDGRELDVESYLKAQREKIIMSVMEKSRAFAMEKFQQRMDKYMEDDWKTRQVNVFDKITTSLASVESSKSEIMPVTPSKLTKYEPDSKDFKMSSELNNSWKVVKKLQECKMTKMPFNAIEEFKKASHFSDSWSLLGSILEENSSVVMGSRKYFEKQYVKFIDNTLREFPREANLGGKPSNLEKIRGFINVKLGSSGSLQSKKLEFYNGVPFWAQTFYLLRAGFRKEAYAFINTVEESYQRVGSRLVYLLQKFHEGNGILPSDLKASVFTEYMKQKKNEDDPYKVAIYQILGGFEKQKTPEIIQTTEDYLWFQLHLIDESYTLASLSAKILQYDPSHFGNNTLMYFLILLSVGEFDRAIYHLSNSSNEKHLIESVNFFIALHHYGLLKPSKHGGVDILSIEKQGDQTVATLNFSQFIKLFTRPLIKMNIEMTVDYLFLVDDKNVLMEELINLLISSSANHDVLLGSVSKSGIRTFGLLNRHVPTFITEADLTRIIKQAAQRIISPETSIKLYNLVNDYDMVLKILSKMLSDELASSSSNKGILEMSLDILNFYITKGSAEVKQTCSLLISLMKVKNDFTAQNYENVLNQLECLFLPSQEDFAFIHQKFQEFKKLDFSIQSHSFLILSMYGESLDQLNSRLKRTNHPFVDELKAKSRILLQFLGLMAGQLSNMECEKINRLCLSVLN